MKESLACEEQLVIAMEIFGLKERGRKRHGRLPDNKQLACAELNAIDCCETGMKVGG